MSRRKTYFFNTETRHKPPKAAIRPDYENMFVVRDMRGVKALKYWLQSRKYNTFVETIDKNGRPIIGLLWDYHFGCFPSEKRAPRGIVLCVDAGLLREAGLCVVNHLSIETQYGREWQKAQKDLYSYGKAGTKRDVDQSGGRHPPA